MTMNRGTLALAGGTFVAGMLLTAAYYIRGGKAPKILEEAFSADTLTDADYQEMHVEKSGSTVDTIPIGLSESFQGAMYLPLQYTTAVANDAPGGPGVIDWQVVYTDPYKVGPGADIAHLPTREDFVEANGDPAKVDPCEPGIHDFDTFLLQNVYNIKQKGIKVFLLLSI